MDVQYLIVIFVVLGAAVFASRGMLKRTRSFSAKTDCGTDCGCSGKSKKASI